MHLADHLSRNFPKAPINCTDTKDNIVASAIEEVNLVDDLAVSEKTLQ